MARKNRGNRTQDVDAVQVASLEDTPRRQFVKTTVAAGIAVCAVGTPICAGVRAVLHPVSLSGGAGKFFQLTTLDNLQEKPQKFSVVGDRRDAWMTETNQKIGSVFLSKVGDEVRAFHSLCPHAGCMIQVGVKKNPKSGNEEELFYCPCHAAHFALNGERLDGVSPRNLDSLEVKVENGHVFVKFENFIFGISDKRS